jgi:hypothetical protein
MVEIPRVRPGIGERRPNRLGTVMRRSGRRRNPRRKDREPHDALDRVAGDSTMHPFRHEVERRGGPSRTPPLG